MHSSMLKSIAMRVLILLCIVSGALGWVPDSILQTMGFESETSLEEIDDSWITGKKHDIHGCRELRSMKYISDGECNATEPIQEVLCAGHCTPDNWFVSYIKSWSKKKLVEWRCVNDYSKMLKVHLLCPDGSSRYYPVTLARSCKCKKYKPQHNRTLRPQKEYPKKEHHGRKHKRRKD